MEDSVIMLAKRALSMAGEKWPSHLALSEKLVEEMLKTVNPESKNSVSGGAETIKDVAGVILAGGRSSRYGRNKALVHLDHVPLIERVLRVMTSIFHNVVLITNTPDEYGYLQIPMSLDIIPGLGPLGGIYTGLKVIPARSAFFVACDMPFLNPCLIRHMVAVREEFDVVVPRISGKVEALHGLYSKKCLSNIESQIKSGTYQIFRFFSAVSVRFVDDDEVKKWDPALRSFLNINTPDELKRLGRPEPEGGIEIGDRTFRQG
ncbi:MAG TPA: molybdenum cofactor guanylyltransferase [Desulfobacteraceae bacterium]|nr:molybdenum cofactor guanylyltransferase [Desulfobacteraceae bacterium]